MYNPETGELSACLWTNCYAGSATVFAATNMDTFVQSLGGCCPFVLETNLSLLPSRSKLPSRLSRRVMQEARFAAWGYGGEGLALDMGKCVLSR